MRLYHPRQAPGSNRGGSRGRLSLLAALLLAWLGTACAAPQATQALIQVELVADGETINVTLNAGSTVQQVLDHAGVGMDALDRTEPPIYTVLSNGAKVKLIRVSEEFEVEQVILPFERQTLRNESLPADKEVLIQRGKNGLQEITYRRVFEDGVEVSSQPIPVNSVILEEPTPEIRMIGVQTPFSPVDVPGRLYYLRDGNLWKIEGNTGDRRAVLTTGDLDGRVLSISPDENWALFTRRADVEGRINELWAGYIGKPTDSESGSGQEEKTLVDLGVDNVIHFADWAPGSNSKIYFSTVEPRLTAPGWQANNDLISLTFADTGWTTKWVTIIEANSGGVYGWWGTEYQWSPDGRWLAYARPDSIGYVDYKTGEITKTLDIVPLQTFGDWAWVPGTAWGPDGNVLYTTEHGASGSATEAETSPDFDLSAGRFDNGSFLRLVSQTGMFAYPLASPLQQLGTGDLEYQIAFLQAEAPERSETSSYRIAVMDRDGSNRHTLFPDEESPGLDPERFWGSWSPAPLPNDGGLALAVVYQGNVWIIDVASGEKYQVTGDGLTTRVIWR
jgi:resuscitation-promoting factor RpfB